MKKRYKKASIPIIIIISIGIITFQEDIKNLIDYSSPNIVEEDVYHLENIPDYDGKDYIIINNNEPFLNIDEYDNSSFEKYSELDSLGRCGPAIANIGKDLMPTEKRGSIGMIKPSGWHTVKYDFVDGKYLYNRCHLIGFQLTGENANEKNLITCTRSTNTGIMLDYENEVANYIKTTNNHVLYRVTPIFEGNNLIAKGILMEGISKEDRGERIKFNIFIYNKEEGVEINYQTGESKLQE